MRKINKNFYSKLGIFCVLISCFSCSNQTDPIFNSSSLKSITSEVIRLKSDPKISKKYLADSLLSKTQEMVKDKNIEIRDREISNAILLCGLLYKVEGQYDNAKDAYLLAKKHSDANSIQHAISSLTLAQISGDDKKFDEAISNFANLTKNFTEINFENVEAANAKVLYKTFLGAFVEYIYLHRLHRTGTQYSDTAVAIECILEWLYEFNTLFDFDAINKEYKIDGIRKFVRECSDMYIKSENNERARQVYKKFSQLEENNVVDKVDKLWLKFKFLINTTESSNERFNQVKNIYENMP